MVQENVGKIENNLQQYMIYNVTMDDEYIFDSEYEQFVERHSLKMRTIRN